MQEACRSAKEFGKQAQERAKEQGPERYTRSAEREDDMKSRHIGTCIVLASGIFVFTGGSIQAQVSSGSPSSGSGNLGGSGAGSGRSMTSPGSGSPGSMGQGQEGPNMSKPLPADPAEHPAQAEATQRFLVAAEWDQGVELAAWVPPAGWVPPGVWNQVEEVWDQRGVREAADDRR